MADKSFAEALNAQISNEFAASQQYIGAAVYYDSETFPRLAAFFYRQAAEERDHAMMMVQFLLDVDEEVRIPDIQGQQTRFDDSASRRCRWRSSRRGVSPRRSTHSSSSPARPRTTAPSSSCSGSSRSRSRRSH